jgi:hypothetical protein
MGEYRPNFKVIAKDRGPSPLNSVECGYFRSMLRKAERGELYLHKSIFGILKRGRGLCDA